MSIVRGSIEKLVKSLPLETRRFASAESFASIKDEKASIVYADAASRWLCAIRQISRRSQRRLVYIGRRHTLR